MFAVFRGCFGRTSPLHRGVFYRQYRGATRPGCPKNIPRAVLIEASPSGWDSFTYPWDLLRSGGSMSVVSYFTRTLEAFSPTTLM